MRFHAFSLALALMIVVPAAQAHVRVQPVESRLGIEQTYTVRVPTEGEVATSRVELEVPAGVSVIRVEGQAETKRIGDRIVSIVWRMEIPPGQSHEFVFVAKNPMIGQEISWKAHQYYTDGSSADWVEAPSSRRPASVTKLNGAP